MLKKTTTSWWQWIVAVDFFLVLITTVHKYPFRFPGKWTISYPFNLAVENNLSSWWSGLHLLVAGLLCYQLFSRNNEKFRKSWLVLSLVFFGLSIDEVGSIHERVGGFAELLPFALVLLLMLTYALYPLVKHHETRKTSLYLILCFVLFGFVAVMEYFEHALIWPTWSVGIRVGAEEGLELIGMLMALYGIVLQRGLKMTGLHAVIPDLTQSQQLLELIGLCFLLHLAACFVLPVTIDLEDGGNPLVWYPSAVFFITFTTCWRLWHETRGVRKVWGWISIIFFSFSAFTIFNPLKMLTNIFKAITIDLTDGVFLLTCLTLFGLICFLRTDLPQKSKATVILASLFLLFLSVTNTDQHFKYIYLGFLSFSSCALTTKQKEQEVFGRV